MITEFAESVKRLYKDRKIDVNKIRDLLAFGKITQEEYNYILGKGE